MSKGTAATSSEESKFVAPVISSVEYLGNKRKLLPFLIPAVRARSGIHTQVLDLFTGTGSVAAGFKSVGFSVLANDHLAWCALSAEAILNNSMPPPFRGLSAGAQRTPYTWVIEQLNRVSGRDGFIYQNYSPASHDSAGVERRYFTEGNARRIDGVRHQIEDWRPQLTSAEYALLVSDLLRAAAAVSNVAGTYGCYLKEWKARALQPLVLDESVLIPGPDQGHEVSREDAEQLLRARSAPVIYADPPYTKRQYAAYYHVLETIALADEPAVEGSTGLRDWRTHASDFCYKRRAPAAIRRLLETADCAHFFLSYSSDGQVPHEDVVAILNDHGRVEILEVSHPRYRSNRRIQKAAHVTERLYHVTMSPS